MEMPEKLSPLHDSTACRATFTSNNLNFLFSVWYHQFHSLLWRNVCPPFFTMLLHFFKVCTSLLRSSHTVPIRLRSGLWLEHCNQLILFFFRHSVVDLLLCLGSLSCCITQFQPRFSCSIDGLTCDSWIIWYTEVSMTARCPGPVAAKQTQIISPPPLCLTVGMRCCAEMLCLVSTRCGAVHHDQISGNTSVSSVQRTLFQKSGDLEFPLGNNLCHFTI